MKLLNVTKKHPQDWQKRQRNEQVVSYLLNIAKEPELH
jgi:hypothetical protein